MDPIMLGTSPIYTDEQTQPDSTKHAVISIDTLYDNTNLTISNNNIFWNSEVTDYWATNDTVSAPNVLSALIVEKLGNAAADAYFSEPLTFSSIPGSILQYVKDLYADPTSEDMYDIIVEDITKQGTAYDSGNLFDFSTFSPCYPTDATSATASTTNGAIGAISFCPDLMTGLNDINTYESSLSIYPNPTTSDINISFSTSQSSDVAISIMDINGRNIFHQTKTEIKEGNHQFSFSIPNTSQGVYILTVQTIDGMMTRKLIFN